MLTTLTFVNPHLRAGWAHVPVPATDPRPLPTRVDAPPDLAAFHAATATNALLVLDDGVLSHAWYADGHGPRDLFLGASATKSVLAHLVGIAGLDIAAPVESYVPELAASGYRGVPVRAVLTMTSGVDWVEDHRDPAGPATALVSAFAAGASSRALLTRIGKACPPETRYAYCTADSQVLDWVRERATGVPFAAALTDLWRDLGCADDAAVAVDGEGVAMAGGGLAATAADWARVGLLQVDGVAPGGARLLDAEWVDAASRPALPFLRPGRLPADLSAHVGFGYHWWPLDGPGDRCGARVAADGSRGQFVYVDRPRRAVVVKTSTWPYADATHDRRCRDLTYRTLPTIVDAVAKGEVVRR